MPSRFYARLCVIAGLLMLTTAAPGSIDPARVPLFQWRARVSSQGGAVPTGKKFTFYLAGASAAATGDAWSDWTAFTRDLAAKAVGKGSYPNVYMKDFPVVLHLTVKSVVDPTLVEVEAKFDGTDAVVPLSGELFGPTLGLMVYKEGDAPKIATMAEYNRRYWKAFENTPNKRPKKFFIVDRFIGGDQDRRDWSDGIAQLSRGGFNAIMLPPDKAIREMLLKTGNRRTAWAVYSPPGYVFDHDPKTATNLTQWAEALAKPYLAAGYEPKDISVFAMGDEPGWYYPSAFTALNANPTALARFQNYVRENLTRDGLAPHDVGVESWDQLKPLGRSGAKDLASKRLFYWTMRFFSWDSSRYFADASKALENALYPGLPTFTNWNFFSGRLYVPGPVANNGDKTSPDAAMGGQDWFEFARLHGGNCLWTEDWFSDAQAWQWSFYCSKLRSAADLGGLEFGGYVIPRTAGDREDGILQKIITIAGSGGKGVKYFVFGPEYNFPGNCYSENVKVLPKMAEAHAMIADAEELLYPGRRPRAQVAILHPRSAEMWDEQHETVGKGISDATNSNLNAATVDYMAEVFDLYTALQHANVPVDFLDEDSMHAKELAPYKVLYVTEPDVPAEAQKAIGEWTKAGGTLVTSPGAARFDRFHEPSDVLGAITGLHEPARDRLLVPDVNKLKPVATGKGELGAFTAIGDRSTVEGKNLMIGAKFSDGSPAVARRNVGKGEVIHFTWWPGLSYAVTPKEKKDGLPVGWSEAIRQWIVFPTVKAGVRVPVVVDRPLVETPLLISDAGAVVTILNWTGEPIKSLSMTVRLPFEVKSVTSVKHGELKFKNGRDGVEVKLAAGAADFVMFRK
jgi:hypothetical protein